MGEGSKGSRQGSDSGQAPCFKGSGGSPAAATHRLAGADLPDEVGVVVKQGVLLLRVRKEASKHTG